MLFSDHAKIGTNPFGSILERRSCFASPVWDLELVWSDMMIETSYMKFGKGPSGIIGKTTKPKAIQIWAKSQLSCSQVLQTLDAIRNKAENTMSTHKEGREGRMMAD